MLTIWQAIAGAAVVAGVVVALVCVAVIVYGGWLLAKAMNGLRVVIDHAAQQQTQAALVVTELVKAVRESPISTLPAAAEGQTKACLATVEAVVSLEKAIDKYVVYLAGGESLQTQTQDKMIGAEREYRIQEIMRSGIDREGAEGRVDSHDLYRNFSLQG
jgi:hypothetical protein